ncbi:biotin transporter BioY [Pararhodobacter sp. CCB-MM2]|uniref:biotin transporter BioY n=1 Tax=Pararhodobacter sp. CCB-MM2 TaxID=1786003 RepID=UPI000832817F|nr:biotin transporter BioY [Pararhodobacter sp. CCB-MM2]MCA2010935.1 biotin transporter BioY [Cereibacter sphaeroides]
MAQQTLLQASVGARSLLVKALAVLGGSAVIALGAQVSVPMLPVPMSLQTLAVLMVGLTAGSRLGAAAVIAYLVEGAMGLPVFAGGAAGLPILMGPTGGFLFGFVAMAFVAGFLAERGMARGVIGTAIAGLIASVALYVPGVLWLDMATGLDLNGAIAAGMTPFLLGDAVKIAIAALAVTGAWTALSSRRG